MNAFCRARFAGAVVALGLIPLLNAFSAPASAYTFGPGVQQTGPEETVFDYSTMACTNLDIPDATAVAFRDASGRVQLHASHFDARRMVGPDLTHLQQKCDVVLPAGYNANPAVFDDRPWLSAAWTPDGNTVYALVHNEYEGWRHPGLCPQTTWPWCLEYSVTLATSWDGGNTFTRTPAPTHLVASLPYQYAGVMGAIGYSSSNIVRRAQDGYYYSVLKAVGYQEQKNGTCIMRTKDLADPSSWRAWDGTGFNTRFINPYVDPMRSPADHVCTGVSQEQIGDANSHLTFSTSLAKFVLVGPSVDPVTKNTVPGFYYSLSDDLIHWTTRSLLMETELPWTHNCSTTDPYTGLYPSLLDPDSASRNFETMDSTMYLFFVRGRWNGCVFTNDRDLVRIPLQLTVSPSSPTAALAASATTVRTGEAVRFDASASGDSNSDITSYVWDLDGNGSFETDTGSDPTTERSYDAAGEVSVKVRVTDGTGDSAETARLVTVEGCHGRKRDCRKACKPKHERRCAAKGRR